MSRQPDFTARPSRPWLPLALLGAATAAAGAQVRLNEIVYRPAALGRDDPNLTAVRVELYNSGDTDVTLAGWVFSNRAALPGMPLPDWTLPAGAFLTVYFGPGTDDADFSDGAGDYYYGGGAFFNITQDECALFNGPPAAASIVDFLAWDTSGYYLPGPAHDLAVAANLWPPGLAINTQQLAAGDSLARCFDGFDRNLLEDWRIVPLTLYVHHYAYRVENPIQQSPRNRAVFSQSPGEFEWAAVPGASAYDLQVATDYLFTALVLNVTDLPEPRYSLAAALPDNGYFWRVRARYGADHTPWAAEWLFLVSADLRAVEDQLCRSCPFKYQRKDTRLLCLWNDSPEGEWRPGCPETGNCAWDIPHPDQSPEVSGCRHGRNYCWAASIAMVNAKYGGDLNQDRIAYENWNADRPEPEGDLGHDLPNTDARITNVLSWALNGAAIDYRYVGAGGFTFAQMRQWIDERECFVAAVPGHCLVPMDYFEYTTPAGTNAQIVYANDPWRGPAHPHVFSYVIAGTPSPYWRRHRTNQFDAVWLQPAGGATARMQEASVTTDSDGDGVMDFDEDPRTLECLPNDTDTDDDEVTDKNEIRNYTFHDKHHRGHENDGLWFSDWDGDGRRSESDCDSDDDSDFDGGEDIDGNGHNPDAGETCLFRPAEKEIVVNVDKDVYLVGEPVFIVDLNSRRTRTYHANSAYWYEYGAGCPARADGDPLGHTDRFFTNAAGRAFLKFVDLCPAPGVYYATVDVLSDSLYSTPDNWDPQTCWICIFGARPVPGYPTPPPTIPPGCPSTPVPVGAPDTYDPDGFITRWVWTINNRVWFDGEYPQIYVSFLPGPSVVTLTVFDNDGLSASASTDLYLEGGQPPPAMLPLGRQINLHDLTDPRYDAITVEYPAQLEFVNDGLDEFARVHPGPSDYWVGPVVDLPLACFQPVDIYAMPFMSVQFSARYLAEPSLVPSNPPPIHLALRDVQGRQAHLGPVWTPDPGLDPLEWTHVEAPLEFIWAEDMFDPAHITQVLFLAQSLYNHELDGFGLEFLDVRHLYLGPGTPPEIPGDCNGDFTVDWNDWLLIFPCLTGPGGTLPPECACADLEQEGDADLVDLALFQRQFGYVIPPQ